MQPVAEVKLVRTFLPPGVKRLEINEVSARGTLFLPTHSGQKLPLVVTLFGGIFRKHVIEEKAAMLAGEGFAAFALSYFGTDPSLPRLYGEVNIGFIEDSIDAVCSLCPKIIDKNRIGLMGSSKGLHWSL